MKPTQQLMAEHNYITLMLKILGRICGDFEAGKEINPGHMDKILEFIKIFADKCHHGKEEGLLFPAMEEAGVPREGGPIGVMLRDHEMGRGYVKGMRKDLSKYKAGDKKSAAGLAENGRKYIELLSQHIKKEDNILYPMADAHLSEEKQSELLREFEKLESEEIGPGKHEEFHKLLRDLKNAYL